MSSVIETFLLCDVCGQNFGVDNRERNVMEQREAAKRNGWIYSGNKDYCPGCRAKNKDGRLHSSIIRKKKP